MSSDNSIDGAFRSVVGGATALNLLLAIFLIWYIFFTREGWAPKHGYPAEYDKNGEVKKDTGFYTSWPTTYTLEGKEVVNDPNLTLCMIVVLCLWSTSTNRFCLGVSFWVTVAVFIQHFIRAAG